MKPKSLDKFFERMIREKGLCPSSSSVYVAILQLCKEQGHLNPFQITRKKVMKYSGIRSIVTYHKCISDLKDRGMVEYHPSYHPKLGSKILLK